MGMCMHKIFGQLFLSIFLLFAVTASYAGESYQYFLTLADIHFDPYVACYTQTEKPCLVISKLRQSRVANWSRILKQYDIAKPQYRLDTNYPLLEASLNSAKIAAQNNHAGFVLVLGDFIGHDFRKYYRKYSLDDSLSGYQSFLNKTLQFVTQEIAKTFPSLDVYMVVGNNDTYSRDYISKPNGAFFKDAAHLWAPLIKNVRNREVMQKQFPYAGYYAVTIANQPTLRLIVLNTVLFSHKSFGAPADAAAIKELAWLDDELKQVRAKHQKAIIAMHIPMGIDVYASMRFHLFTLVNFWKPNYTAQFKSEMKAFSPEIAGILSGHIHSDWFQEMSFGDSSQTIAMSGTPSVSPIFGNNPGFKIYRYPLSIFKIQDDYTYYLPIDNKNWGLEYEFERIRQPNCHTCLLLNLPEGRF